MRRSLLAAGLLAFILPAFATGNHTPEPKPPTATAGAKSGSKATAGSKSTSGSASSSKATGGASKAVAGDSAASADNGVALDMGTYQGDDVDAPFIALPAPSFTPPLPLLPRTSCLEAAQQAKSIGWSFASDASGGINPKFCISIDLYNAFIEQCKYESANRMMTQLSKAVMPDFVPVPATYEDLDMRACNMIKSPPPKEKVVYLPFAPEPKVEPVALPVVKEAPKPKAKPKAKPVAAPVDDCALADAKAQSCKAKPRT